MLHPYDMGKKVQVCREWEATACQVNQEDVRLVLLRIGVVLGKDGGALGCCVSFTSFCLFFLLSFCFLPQGEGSFPSALRYLPDSSVHLQQR